MIGDIQCIKENLNDDIVDKLSKRYIAIDVETTGLNPAEDLITEIGLVEFVNGKKIREYQSLIHINILLDDYISELTGITNDMLFNAPREENVYKEVIEFLGDTLDEGTILVAHNASFDMSFISRALIRYGYIGVIHYVDTLSISRSLVKGLFNYKQDTVATYFNIVNKRAHRAATDAEVCGEILSRLIDIYKKKEQTIDIETKYDKYFEKMVRERGIIYYRFNLVNNYEVIDNHISAIVKGSNIYKVDVDINEDNITGTCECPYYKENNKLCKHMYALILKHESKKDL